MARKTKKTSPVTKPGRPLSHESAEYFSAKNLRETMCLQSFRKLWDAGKEGRMDMAWFEEQLDKMVNDHNL